MRNEATTPRPVDVERQATAGSLGGSDMAAPREASGLVVGSLSTEATFAAFFDLVGPQLLRAAFLMTGSRQDAEDLTQEVLTRAWQHWRRLVRHDHPEAWARRVLGNLVINRWRRRTLERRRGRPIEPGGTVDPASVGHLDVIRALGELPVRSRQAIVLHDVIGLSVGEIASEMGVPEGTVRSWLHRSRDTLARKLELDNPKLNERKDG